MSTPILAPKDAHVILSKVTANTMLIHNVFYHQTSCPLFILFSKLHKKGIDFEISTSKQIYLLGCCLGNTVN